MNSNPNPDIYPGPPKLLKHIGDMQVWHSCSWCLELRPVKGLGPVEAEVWFKQHMIADHPVTVTVAPVNEEYKLSLTLSWPGYGIDEQAISTMAETLKLMYYQISRNIEVTDASILRNGEVLSVDPAKIPITYN